MSSYNFLLAERDRQWNNIESLELLNDELERTRSNLLYDQDTMMIHARQMGYGQHNERFVRIVGLGTMNKAPSTAGNIYYAQNPVFISDRSMKIVSLSIGLLVFIFLFMLEVIERRSR